MVEKFRTGITKIIDSCNDAGNPVPIFETASSSLDFYVRAIEKYRVLNNDSVVDYRKVLATMDKLTEDGESDVMINSNVRINVRLSEEICP